MTSTIKTVPNLSQNLFLDRAIAAPSGIPSSMETAQVVGIEARNYLQNHTARGALLPTITEQEAQKAVSSRLQIESSQLCLIPLRSEERLCFEFKGFYNGHTYLAYVDAATGEQVELLKLVETPSGLETV